jgi:hypothetical protein
MASFTFIYKDGKPGLRVVIKHAGNEETLYALVDSGSDYCVFPYGLVKKLGLKQEDAMRESETFGFGSPIGHKTTFWWLLMEFDKKLSLTVPVGFSERQEESQWGVLGRTGFFSQFSEVTFREPNYFVVKEKDGQAGPSLS